MTMHKRCDARANEKFKLRWYFEIVVPNIWLAFISCSCKTGVGRIFLTQTDFKEWRQGGVRGFAVWQLIKFPNSRKGRQYLTCYHLNVKTILLEAIPEMTGAITEN